MVRRCLQYTMMLHRLRHARFATLLLTLCVGVLLVAPSTAMAASQGCADDETGITDMTASWQSELLRLTNEHRASKGLVALRLDTTLTRASMWKARDMARRNYFSHDDVANGSAPARDPWARLESCGWNTGGSRAENIAAGYASAQATVTGWLNSPGHRANIENGSLRYVGFGVASSETSSYGRYQVQMFASVAGPTTTQPMASLGSTTRDPRTVDTRATTTIENLRARVLRSPCTGTWSVQGWCYRIIVIGQTTSSASGRRQMAIYRRTATGRLVRMVRFTTTEEGRFGRRLRMRPPARNTAAWLRNNATRLRVSAGGTTEAAPKVQWTYASMMLRRR